MSETLSAPRFGSRAREDAELFEEYRRSSARDAREALLERFLPLATHLARRYGDRGERDDLQQVASFALLKAIDRYDPERGLAFSSYAVPTILGELKRYFRDFGWSVRVPRDLQERSLQVRRAADTLRTELGRSPRTAEIAERIGASVEDVLEALQAAAAHRADSLDAPVGGNEDTPLKRTLATEDAGYAAAEDAATLSPLLAQLTPRERTIVRLRFEDDLTQSEIGELIGVSQMQVSRVLRQAIATMSELAATRCGGAARLAGASSSTCR